LVIAELTQAVPLPPEFPSLLGPIGVPNGWVDELNWPPLYFILAGPGGNTITLACYSGQHWQRDAGQQELSQFMLIGQSDETQPTILGLILLTGYCTIFDRSMDGLGVINFAQKPLM
jgi:hypothetical protein